MSTVCYKFSSGDQEVVLTLDTEILTEAMAREINSFTGGDQQRLDQCDGDVRMAVAKAFALLVIRYTMAELGGLFTAKPQLLAGTARDALAWVGEGWPDFDALGIQLTSVDTTMPEFDDLLVDVLA